DNPNSGANQIYSGTAHNTSYATLLGRYLGSTIKDPFQGLNLGVFKCPNDILIRDGWLLQTGAGTLSYTMPGSWGPDTVYYNKRWLGIGDLREPKSGVTLNRGIGQLWDASSGAYPLWIRTSMVHPAGEALLLVERSYTEEAQCTNWNLGYQVTNPASQMWDPTTAFYGFPLLHTNEGNRGSRSDTTSRAGKKVGFNYLYCDYHVEFLNPRATVHDLTTIVPGGWEGGD